MREEELQAIWSRIPSIRCKGKCAESCGPILMSSAEFTNLREYVGERIQGEPVGESKEGAPMIVVTNTRKLACPLLKDERCSAYEQRPAICRMFGVVKAMRCPFGCVPDKWLRDVDAGTILKELGAL